MKMVLGVEVLMSLAVGSVLWLGIPVMTVMAIVVVVAVGDGGHCHHSYWGW